MDKVPRVLLRDGMWDTDEFRVLQYAVAEGRSSFEIFVKLLEGIREVDTLYEAGQYFIADLMMAGHILKA